MLNPRLLAAIQQLPGIGAESPLNILQCSSAGATGAIILHVWVSSEPEVRAVIKTSRDPESDHHIDDEWKILVDLARDERYTKLLPMPLARTEIDGATFYAYRGLPGATQFAQYRNRIFESRRRMLLRFARQALEASRTLHAAPRRNGGVAALAADIENSLEALRGLVPGLPGSVAEQASQAAAVLRASELELPFGRVHGDFSPYNILSRGRGANARIGVIDWEHSEPERPQHLDILRFISSFELMGRRFREGASALFRMWDPQHPLYEALWLPWLELAGSAACSPQAYRALWIHFFITAAYREQKREKYPARFDTTTYLPGLIELARG